MSANGWTAAKDAREETDARTETRRAPAAETLPRTRATRGYAREATAAPSRPAVWREAVGFAAAEKRS